MTNWTELASIASVLALIVAVVALGLEWYKFKKNKNEIFKPQHLFEEKGSDWLLERKLTYVDLLKRLIALDVASMDHMDFDDPAEGTAAQWAPVFEYSPETWRLIVYNQMSVAAYWQFVSLKPSALRRLRSGLLKDSAIKTTDIRKINEPGEHSIYVIFIGIHPDFENRFGVTLFDKLMKSVANVCNDLDENRVKIKEIFANGQTREGIFLCRHLSMQQVGEICQGGPLFHALYSELNWKIIRRYEN
jgi:hypothetical protein